MASLPDTISKIAVRGFKSIADEQQIEVRPLTLLAGANSSGKSSIMQPVLLLKQTLEAPSDPGPLLLDGPNVRFTSVDQFASRMPGKAGKPEFAVRIELSDGSYLEPVFNREKATGLQLATMYYGDGTEKLRVVPDMSQDDILKVLPKPFKEFYGDAAGKRKGGPHWSVRRERCFLSFALSIREVTPPLGPLGVSPTGQFIRHLQGLLHLPGLRGNPLRTYAKSAGGPLFPGTFENYVASMISKWQATNDPRLSRLGSALADMGLTWKVRAEPVDDTQVELKVGRLMHSTRGGAHDLVSIADVGFGLSQSLPVVLALILASPGQVVYLEKSVINYC